MKKNCYLKNGEFVSKKEYDEYLLNENEKGKKLVEDSVFFAVMNNK